MSEAFPSSSSDPAPDRPRSRAPISINGLGAVTGYGWGKKHVWDGFLLGESAVKLVSGLDGYLETVSYTHLTLPTILRV